MIKALSFVRLDLLTVKPYLTKKNMFILILIPLVMMSSTRNYVVGIIMVLMIFAAMYTDYPFASCERYNLDVLYSTLSIKRNTVVLGRYLFNAALIILIGIYSFVASHIIFFIVGESINISELMIVIPVLLIAFSFIRAVQLPIYFKLSYSKAKFYAKLPILILPMAFLIFPAFFSSILSSGFTVYIQYWYSNNLPIAVLLSCAAWFGLVYISYRISVSFYRKREF